MTGRQIRSQNEWKKNQISNLETKTFLEKTNTLSEIIEFYLHDEGGFKGSIQ